VNRVVAASVAAFVLALATLVPTLVLTFPLAGCSDDSCGASNDVAYTCEPQATTANACEGGPMIDGVQHDADKNYALGCFAGVPVCVDGKPVIDDCECIAGFSGNTWVCN
jgi:hypothetical protein